MDTRAFIVVQDTDTIGHVFRELANAHAHLGWYVIVRYADHYGASQAGELAQSVINRGAQAALSVRLSDVTIPPISTTSTTPPALRLENNAPAALIISPTRGLDLAAKAAFDQLIAAVQPGALPSAALATRRRFVVVPHTATVGDALDALQVADGNPSWCLVVRQPHGYDVIGVDQLLTAMIGKEPQAILKTPLAELNIYPRSLEGVKGQPTHFSLELENGYPVAVLDYQPTHRGMPLELERAFEQMRGAAQAAAPRQFETTDARARYVNTWFTDRIDGEPFGRECSLARRRRYFVQLHIGPMLQESIIVAPRPLDHDLPPIPDAGLPLLIKLFSRDFEIENDTTELRLFKTGPTRRLHLAVTAPDITGLATLRIGVYYQNNLVQSVLLHARIDEQEMKRGRGDYATWAKIEYSLSHDLTDITQLQPRRLCIWVNDAPHETHTVSVVGTPVSGALNISDNRITRAATEFRNRLLEITMNSAKQYRYRPDNSGDEEKFIEDIKTLAYLGVNLFECIFAVPGAEDWTDNLSQALAGSQPAVIQVANLASDFLYPWAGIYDRPLHPARTQNRVCLKPLQHRTPQAALAACGNCAHSDETNTICLAGFWGFRHIIEQPLGKVEPDGKPFSAVLKIPSGGKLRASMSVYVGADLSRRAQHQQWVVQQFEQYGGQVLVADSQQQAHQDIPQPQQLCYFYCHGGSSPEKLNPWLKIGQNDYIQPPDVRVMGLDKSWRKQGIHPLVFINACHSFEFTPEALAAFLPRFAWAGAAGVIGTEVSIFEPLAVEFGEGIIEAFLRGEPIGQAIQRLRWQLLLKRNVLGLVYTPYCYADLCRIP